MNITANPELRETNRLPFGIYAIVFFLALHILALILDLLRVQYGVVVDFMDTFGQLILEEFGLGRLFGQFVKNESGLIIVDLTFTVLLCVIIAGLLAKKRWAWVSTMILIGASLLISLVHYFNEDPRFLNMLVGVMVVFYLNERNVQHVYERRTKAEEQVA
jgi:hypothetical protein